jgi:hypothetical protein
MQMETMTIDPCEHCGSTRVIEHEPMWVRWDWYVDEHGTVQVEDAHDKESMPMRDSAWECADCGQDRVGPYYTKEEVAE